MINQIENEKNVMQPKCICLSDLFAHVCERLCARVCDCIANVRNAKLR